MSDNHDDVKSSIITNINQGNVIQNQPKGLIMPNGSVKKLNKKKKVVSEDGREITDPIIVSASEYTNVLAAVQSFPMLRDMIIMLRATIENEITIQKGKDDKDESITRLQDILDIAEQHLGPMPKMEEVAG